MEEARLVRLVRVYKEGQEGSRRRGEHREKQEMTKIICTEISFQSCPISRRSVTPIQEASI